MIPEVQIPDFVGGLQRQQALTQQGEMSRLQMLALQQAQDDARRFDGAIAAAAPGLMAGQGPQYASALATLAGAGRQGLTMALPLIQRNQGREEFNSIFGGGAPAPSGGAPEGDTSQPRGIRNNNPLNIVDAPFTRNQPGFVGTDGRFARFNSPEEGLAAADTLLQSYAQRGLNTPLAIISSNWFLPSRSSSASRPALISTMRTWSRA